jgi:hypothetical protein
VRQQFPFIHHIYLEADAIRSNTRNTDAASFPETDPTPETR